MSTVTTVRIAVPDGEQAADHLRDNYISVEESNPEWVEVALETGRGDNVVKIADGTVRIVQDAMVAKLPNADVVVVSGL